MIPAKKAIEYCRLFMWGNRHGLVSGIDIGGGFGAKRQAP